MALFGLGAVEPKAPQTLLNCEANIGAFIIRIGFRGALYYHYNKDPPQTKKMIGNYLDPYIQPKALPKKGAFSPAARAARAGWSK